MKKQASHSAILAMGLSILLALGWGWNAVAQSVRPGFNTATLPANDDGSTGLVPMGFSINYFGINLNSLYVNNNGNVTFDQPLGTYTPFDLNSTNRLILAPFFADVDTRGAGSNVVTYGAGAVNGFNAFGVNWVDVGYFGSHADKLNSFQLVIIDRSDTGAGNFMFEFNYDRIVWETGDASSGNNGFGGFSARAGYSNGTGNPGTFFEFPGSAVNGALLDGGPNSLTAGGARGRYLFVAYAGNVTPPDDGGGTTEAAPVRRRERPITYLIVDTGAIHSLLSTGLMMPVVQRQAVRGAASATIRDLNSRLFRARSRGATPGGSPSDSGPTVASPQSFAPGDERSTLPYLAFAASQNIDYRVAFGLRDGVEVEIPHDTMTEAEEALWVSSPFALAGGPALLAPGSAYTKAVIAAPSGSETSGKKVFQDSVVIKDPNFRRFEVFTEFDYGFYDQDPLTNLVRGFDSDTYAGSVGMEYRLFPWLQIGGAFTLLESNLELSSQLGGVDLEGHLLSGYFTAFWRRLYLDVLYSYGDFDNEINRNTLLGTRALGDTDSFSHNVSINLGQNYSINDQIVVGPYTGLDYATGGIGDFVERGGGDANLIYPDDNFESMIGRLGWQVTYCTDSAIGPLTMQGRAGWGHEFMPEADTVRAGLANSPFIKVTGNTARRVGGFAAEANSAHPGQDWLELGAGLRFDLNRDWNLQCDYEGQFGRNNASAHFASAKLEYEWGEKFLSRFSKDVSESENTKRATFHGFANRFPIESPAIATAPCESLLRKKTAGEADDSEPECYESWDEVPGRWKASSPGRPPKELESVTSEVGGSVPGNPSAVNR